MANVHLDRAALERLSQAAHDENDHETADAARLLLDNSRGTPEQVEAAYLRVATVQDRDQTQDGSQRRVALHSTRMLMEANYNVRVAIADAIGTLILLCGTRPQADKLADVAIDMIGRAKDVFAAKQRTRDAIGEATP